VNIYHDPSGPADSSGSRTEYGNMLGTVCFRQPVCLPQQGSVDGWCHGRGAGIVSRAPPSEILCIVAPIVIAVEVHIRPAGIPRVSGGDTRFFAEYSAHLESIGPRSITSCTLVHRPDLSVRKYRCRVIRHQTITLPCDHITKRCSRREPSPVVSTTILSAMNHLKGVVRAVNSSIN